MENLKADAERIRLIGVAVILMISVCIFPVMAIVIAPAAFAVSTAFTVSGVALREQMTAIHLSSNSFGVACTNSLLV